MPGINAISRLERFISAGLQRLQEGSEEELFYLYPEKLPLDYTSKQCDSQEYELEDYLSMLNELQLKDIDVSFADKKWLARTEIVVQEMVNYTLWIHHRYQERADVDGFVFALRDALLPFLGFSLLEPERDIVPVMLGRKFLARFGDVFYSLVTPPIYQILEEQPTVEYGEFVDKYKQAISSLQAEKFDPVRSEITSYLNKMLGKSNYVVVESGVQGSIPLLISALTEKINQFVMYTTAPWLYNVYRPVVFRTNYNYLREIETLLSQDKLFDFSAYRDGRIYVNEFQDKRRKALAYYEIALYREALAAVLHENEMPNR